MDDPPATVSWPLLESGRAWPRPWESPEAPERGQVVTATRRAITAVAASGVVGAAAAAGVAGDPLARAAVRDQVPCSRLDSLEVVRRAGRTSRSRVSIRSAYFPRSLR